MTAVSLPVMQTQARSHEGVRLLQVKRQHSSICTSWEMAQNLKYNMQNLPEVSHGVQI